MKVGSLLLWTALVAGTVAGPPGQRRSSQCATECTGSNKFNYEKGTSYLYNYEAKTTTSTGEDSETFLIRAKVEIEAVNTCNLLMRVRDVSSSEKGLDSSEYKKFQEQLEKFPLVFAFQDGRVETLCPPEEELPWVLNFKRGILTVFQNSMDKLDRDQTLEEVDVTGRCQANYEILNQGWRSTTLKKSKDLTSCEERHGYKPFIPSNPYTAPSAIKSLPLLKSNHECQHTIGNGIMQEASCTEEHIFQPFARDSTTATTTTLQTLSFSSSVRGHLTGNDYVPTQASMMYDYEENKVPSENAQQEAENALTKLCEGAIEDIRPFTSGHFSEFTAKIADLNYKQLQDIYENIDTICRGSTKGKKFFIDALLMSSGSGVATLIRDLILREEVGPKEADMWFLSMSFVPNPTKELVSALTALVDVPEPKQKAIFSLSAVIRAFCQHHDECTSVPEVRAALKKFDEVLENDCNPENRDNEENIILFLKAIRNAGQTANLGKLKRCFTNHRNPVEIRIAAIEALHNMPCDKESEALLKLVENNDEDTEVRIAAYSILMRCPTPELLEDLKMILEKENVNQVGSFIWSHLNKIQGTMDPQLKELKAILHDRTLAKKFSTDARKFSRVFGGGIHSDDLNVGAQLDGDVIFSSHSYLPRSASINLTLDLFGQPLNILEMGGRAEGFEPYVEEFFSEKGYGPEVNKILKSLRKKRSTDNKLNQIAESFNVKENLPDEPKASMYMRILGTDVHYTTFPGGENEGLLGTIFRLANSQQVDFTKSFNFLDSTFIIPTSSGFPFTLQVNATAVVNLQMKGNINLDQISQKDFELSADVKPSAVVQVAGTMGVTTPVNRIGLRLKSTIHTSTAFTGKLELRNGEVFKIQVEAPRQKMEIMDISSEVYMLHQKHEKLQRGSEENQIHSKKCSGYLTSKPLGMEFCTELSYPRTINGRVSYPFSGPLKATIYWQKTDPTLTHYEFEYRWQKEEVKENSYVKTGRISFNTPHSTVDRELTAEFIMNQPERSITARLQTPFKTLAVNGKFASEAHLKKLEGSVSIDGHEQLALKAELRKDVSNGVTRYDPSLYFILMNRPVVSLQGYSVVHEGKKLGVDLTLEHLTEKPINIKVDASRVPRSNNDRYDIDVNFKSTSLLANAKGFAQFNGRYVSTKFGVDYTVRGLQRERMEVTTKFRDTSSSGLTRLTANAEVQGTVVPVVSAAWEFQHTKNYLEHTLNLTKDHDLQKTLSMRQIFSYQRSPEYEEGVVLLVATCPATDLDWKAELRHNQKESYISNTMNIYYAPGKIFTAKANFGSKSKQRLDTGVDFQLNHPGVDVHLNANIRKPTDKEYELALNGHLHEGEDWQLKMNCKDESTNDRQLKHSFKTYIIAPSKAPVILKGNLEKGNKFALQGELEYDHNKYALTTEYQKSSDEQERQLQGKITLPTTEYSGKASLINRDTDAFISVDLQQDRDHHIQGEIKCVRGSDVTSGTVEIKWDADINPSKRFLFNTELKHPTGGHDVAITIEYPSRTIRLTFTTQTDGQLRRGSFTHSTRAEIEWQPKEIVAIALDLNRVTHESRAELYVTLAANTPFHGWEAPRMVLTHVNEASEWKTEFRAQKEPERLYSIMSEGRLKSWKPDPNFETSLKIVRPEHEPIIISLDYLNNDREIKSNAALQWKNDKRFTVALFGNNNSGKNTANFVGGINITTPVAVLSSFSTGLRYSQENGKLNVRTDVNWNEYNHVLGEFVGYMKMEDGKIDIASTIQLSTSFENLKNIISTARYNNDGSNLSSFAEIAWQPEQRISLEVVGSAQPTSNGRNMAGSVHFISPFHTIDDVLLTVSHEEENKLIRNNIELKWDNEKTIAFRLDASVDLPNNLQAAAVLTTPFESLEEASASAALTMKNGKVDSSAHLKLGEKSVVLVLNGVFKDKEITFTSKLNTPFNGVREIILTVTHSRTHLEHNTEVDLVYNGKKYSIATVGSFRNWLNFRESVQINTPNRGSMNFGARHSIKDGRFAHYSEADFGQRNKYTMVVEYEDKRPDSGSKQEFNLQFSTPSGSYGPYKGEMYTELNGKTKKSVAAFIYKPGKKVEAISITHLGDSFGQGDFILKTPIFNDIILSGKYERKGEEALATVAVKWAEDRKVELASTLKFKKNRGDLHMTVTTPFEGFENISLGGNYDSSSSTKTLKLKIGKGKQIIEMTAVGMLQYRYAYGELSFTLPIKGWEKLYTSGKIDLAKQTKSIYLIIEKNEVKSEALGTLNYDIGQPEIQLQITTPVDGAQLINIYGKYNINKPQKAAYASLQVDDFKSSVMAEIAQLTNSSGEGLVTFQSSISGLENVVLKGQYDLGLQENLAFTRIKKTATISLERNSDRIEIEQLLNYEEKDENIRSEGLLRINTPFKNYEKLKLSAKLETQSYHEMLVVAVAQREGDRLELEGTLKQYNENGEATLSIATPFHKFQGFTLSTKYDISTPSKMAMASLQVGNERAELKGTFTTEYTRVEADLKLITTIPNFEESKIQVAYDYGRVEKFITLLASQNKNALSGYVGVSYSPDYLTGEYSVELTNTFKAFNPIKATGKYDFSGSENTFVVSIAVGHSKSKISGKADTSKNGLKIQCNINLPIDGWENVDSIITIDGTTYEKNIHVKLEKNFEVSDLSGKIIIGDNSAEAEMFASTPHHSYGPYRARGSYEPIGRDRSVTLTLQSKDKTIEIKGRVQYDDTHVQSKLTLKTPFQGAENVILQGHLDVSKSEKTAKFSMQHNDNRCELLLTLNLQALDQAEFSAAFTSSSASYNDMKMNVRYNLSKREKTASAIFQWNSNQQIKVDTYLMLEGLRSNVKLTVTTPFDNYQNNILAARYDLAGQDKNIAMSFINPEVKFEFSATSQVSATVDCNIKINIVTPIHQWEAMNFSVNYREGSKGESLSLETRWPKGYFTLNGRFSNNLYKNMDAELTLTSSCVNFQSLQFRSNVDFRDEMKASASAIWNNSKKVQLSGNVNEDFTIARLLFTSPFQNFESISLSGKLDLSTRNKIANVIFKWNADKVDFTVTSTSEHLVYEGRASLATTYPGYELMSAEVSCDLRQTLNLGRITLQKSEEKIELIAKGYFNTNQNNINIIFTSPFKGFRSLSTLLKYDLTQNPIKATAAFNWDDGKIEIDYNYEKGPKNSLIQFTVSTPFPSYEHTAVTGRYDFAGSEKTATMVSEFKGERTEFEFYLQGDIKSGNLKCEFKSPYTQAASIIGHYDLNLADSNTFLTVKWASNQIDISGNLHTEEYSGTGTFTVTTPFTENFKVEVKVDASKPQLQVDTVIEYSTRKRIELLSKIEINLINYNSGNFTLKTPYEGYEELSLKTKYDTRYDQVAGLFEFQWTESNHIELTGNIKPNQFLVKIDTPFRPLKDFIFRGATNTDRKGFSANLGIQWENIKEIMLVYSHNYNLPRALEANFKIETSFEKFPLLKFDTSYSLTSSELNINANLNTPFEFLKTANSKVQLRFSSEEIDGKIAMSVSGRHVQITGKVENNFPQSANCLFQIESNVGFIPSASFDARFKKDRQSVELQTRFIATQQVHAFSLVATANNGQVNIKAHIETPLISNSPLNLESNGVYTSSGVEGSFRITGPEYTHFGNVKLSKRDDLLTGEAKLESPAVSHGAINIKIDIQQNPSRHEAKFVISTPSMVHTIVGVINLQNGYEISLAIESPSLESSPLSINIQYVDGPRSAEVTFIVGNAERIHRITGSTNWNQSSISFKVIVETPIFGIQSLALDGYLMSKDKTNEASLSLTTPTATHSFSINTVKESHSIVSQVKLTTPYLNINSVTANARISNNKWKNMDFDISLVTSSTTHSIAGNFQNDGRKLISQLKLRTPFFNINSVAINFKFANNNFKNIEAFLNVVTTGTTHGITLSYKHDSNGITAQSKIETPFLNINTLSLLTKFAVVYDRSLDALLLVASQHRTHSLTLSLQKDGSIKQGTIKLDTPIFGIETLALSAKWIDNGIRNREAIFAVITGRATHSLQLRKQQLHSGDEIRIKLDTALFGIESVTVIIKLRNDADKIQALELSLLTPGQSHTFFGNLETDGSKKSGILKVNSPYFRPISVKGTANNKKGRQGTAALDLETSGKSFHISGRYSNDNFKDMDANLKIITPFESFPLLIVDGFLKTNIDQQETYLGMNIETATDNYTASGKLGKTSQGTSVRMNFNSPIKNYENILVEGIVKYDRRSNEYNPILTISVPRAQYVANIKIVPNPSDFSVSGYLEWDQKRSELIAVYRKTSDSLEVRSTVDSPLLSTNPLSASAKLKYEPKSISMEINLGKRKYSLTAACVGNGHKVDINLPIVGYEHLSVLYENTVDSGTENMLLEVIYPDNQKHSIEVVLSRTVWKVQVATPYRQLRSAALVISKEKDEFVIKLDHNDTPVMEVSHKFIASSGTHYVKLAIINRPPMTIAFTHVSTTRGLIIKGEYSWDANSRSTSAVGFDFELKTAYGNHEIIFMTLHPTRSMKLVIVCKSNDVTTFHKSEFLWDVRSGQGLTLEISTNDRSERGKILFDTVTKLTAPMRALELGAHHEQTNTDQISSAYFKWDASRDDNKRVGAKYEYHDMSIDNKKAKRVELSLQHPQLEKDLAIRGEVAVNNGRELFRCRTEFEYSRFQRQKFSVEAKVKDETETGEEAHYTVELKVLHPSSNLDLSLLSDLANTSQEMAANFQLNYMDRFGQKRKLEMISKILKLKREIDMQMNYPEHRMAMKGQVGSNADAYTLNLESKFDDDDPMKAEAEFNRKIAYMNVLYGPEGKRNFYVGGGMPHRKLITMEAYHGSTDDRIQDALFLAHLNGSRLLDTNLQWRPEAAVDTANHIANKYENLKNHVSSTADDFYNFVSEEVNDKTLKISDSMSKALAPLVDDTKKEINSLLNDLKRVIEVFNNMIEKNEFYLNDITYCVKSVVQLLSYYVKDPAEYVFHSVADSVSHGIHKGREAVYNMKSNVHKGLGRVVDAMDKTVQKTQDLARSYAYDTHRFMKDGLTYAASRASDGVQFVHKRITPAAQQFVDYCAPILTSYLDRVLSRIQNLLDNAFELFHSCMDNIYEIPVVRGIVDFLETLLPTEITFDSINSQYSHITGFYADSIKSGFNSVRGTFEDIATHPKVKYVTEMATDTYNQAKGAYHHYEIEDKLREMIHQIGVMGKRIIVDVLYGIAIDFPYVDVDKSRTVLIDPEHGHIEYTQELPFDWEQFDELPKYQDSKEWKDALDWKDKVLQWKDKTLTPLFDWFSWDIFSNSQPKRKMQQFLPPFESYAMLVGKQHYITFDKKFIEFAGECSYLLAHDFVNENFTVVVNYAGDKGNVIKKSITAQIGEVKVEIGPNYKVSVDDKKIELPQEKDSVILRREGPSIFLESPTGIEIQYNIASDIFILKISGWYQGHTGGLLGTYDNEPYNDLRKPDRSKAQDLVEFASSWQLGSAECITKTNLAVEVKDADEPNICTDLFKNRNSPLRFGFGKVDPQPFLQICQNELAARANKIRPEEGACLAAAAYVENCRLEDIDMQLPAVCVRCSLPNDQTMVAGAETVVRGKSVPRSADTVFLVEEKSCNADGNALEEVIKGVEHVLRAEGIRNNRYALVGFGGTGVHDKPHVHTVDGQVFGSARSMSSAFNSLQFGEGSADLLTALRYVTRLPFRAVVSKNIIVLPCSDVQDGSKFAKIEAVLFDHEITVHVLLNEDLELINAKNSKGKEILGIDSDYAYTIKDVQDKTLRGDSDLLQQVSVPKLMYIPLALETNGSVFVRRMLSDFKSRAGKMAVDVFARRLRLTAEPRKCQVCQCVYETLGQVTTVCQSCSRNRPMNFEMPRMKPDSSFGKDLDEYLSKPDTSVKFKPQTWSSRAA